MLKFNLTKQNLPNLISKLNELDFKKTWSVKITERKPIRSLSQNDRYWAMLQVLGDYLGYSSDELHDLLKFKYLTYTKEIAGQPVTLTRSTADLTTEEFMEYNNQVERFANQYGCMFNDMPVMQ